jgi:hypothetical protein
MGEDYTAQSNAPLATVSPKHFQPRLLRRLAGIRGRSREPAFHLLKTNRVLRPRLADFDVEHGGGTNFFNSRVRSKLRHGHHGGFVERFGLHLDAMSDLPVVNEADETDPLRHEATNPSTFAICSPSTIIEVVRRLASLTPFASQVRSPRHHRKQERRL